MNRAPLIKIRAQRKTPHKCVASLITQMHLQRFRHAVDSTDIKRRVLRNNASKFMTVIVTVVFQLKAQLFPWRLIFNATKKCRRPMKHFVHFKLASTPGEITAPVTPGVAHLTKRVGDIAAFGHIAPAHSHRKIKWPDTFTGSQIFTVK